jgi:hypothetical protein
MNKTTTDLQKRIDLLNSLTSPSEAAWSDREYPKLSYLVDYSFKRDGGGRTLEYAKWNRNRIDDISEEDFNEIIEHCQILLKIREKYGNMDLFDWLEFITPHKESECIYITK